MTAPPLPPLPPPPDEPEGNGADPENTHDSETIPLPQLSAEKAEAILEAAIAHRRSRQTPSVPPPAPRSAPPPRPSDAVVERTPIRWAPCRSFPPPSVPRPLDTDPSGTYGLDPADLSDASSPNALPESKALPSAEGPGDLRPRQEARAQSARGRPVLALALVVGLGGAALAVGYAFVRRAPAAHSGPTAGSQTESDRARPWAPSSVTSSVEPPTAPSATPASLASTPPVQCVGDGPARLVADGAEGAVGVEIAAGAQGVTVAFAAGRRVGVIGKLDPDTLALGETERISAPRDILRVLPTTDTSRRRVDTTRWSLGALEASADRPYELFASGSDETGKRAVLSGKGGFDAPRAVQENERVAVAFRWEGSTALTVLTRNSLPAAAPVTHLGAKGAQVGDPTIASRGDALWVAWTERTAKTGPLLKLARGTWAQDVPEILPLPLETGADAEQSPSFVERGPGESPLLLWTERRGPQFRVRGAFLKDTGTDRTGTFDVSLPDQQAGQGKGAMMDASRGVAVYLVSNPRGSSQLSVYARKFRCHP
jgi:hypothetical protein